MTELWGTPLSRRGLQAYCTDLSQIAETVSFTYDDGPERGTRAVRVVNGGGLDFVVLTDRGMGIGPLSHNSLPLCFRTAAGAVHPSFCNAWDTEWLRTWPAGFLTPCGLDNVGGPINDSGKNLPLHGRLSSIPAMQVSHSTKWIDEHRAELVVEGTIRQSALFGENLILKRTITTPVGSKTISITDEIENLSFADEPIMFLQHINLGYPLVSPHAQLALPKHTTVPRDAEAEKGMNSYLSCSEPIAGFAEQVFYHDCTPDESGMIEISFINKELAGGIGIRLRYSKDHYPNFVQWKMMGKGTYVMGLEPANCRVEGRARERERGTLEMIPAGGKIKKQLFIDILSECS